MSVIFKTVCSLLIAFISSNCYSQPKKKWRDFHKTIQAFEKRDSTILLLDGVRVPISMSAEIEASDVISISSNKDSILNPAYTLKPIPTVIELSLKNNDNLKFINKQSGFWTRKFPSTIYMINNTVLSTDEQLVKLKRIKKADIEAIKTLTPEEGRQLLGDKGLQGVLIILTKNKIIH